MNNLDTKKFSTETGIASSQRKTPATTSKNEATNEMAERGWAPQDEGTSSPPNLATGTSNFSGTAYRNEGPSGSTFTRENMMPPTSGLSSIPGGKSGRSSDKKEKTMARGKSHSPSERAGAHPWTSKAKEWAEQIQAVASDAANKAQQIAHESVDGMSSTVRRFPTESLLVGFSVGALIGILLPRR